MEICSSKLSAYFFCLIVAFLLLGAASPISGSKYKCWHQNGPKANASVINCESKKKSRGILDESCFTIWCNGTVLVRDCGIAGFVKCPGIHFKCATPTQLADSLKLFMTGSPDSLTPGPLGVFCEMCFGALCNYKANVHSATTTKFEDNYLADGEMMKDEL